MKPETHQTRGKKSWGLPKDFSSENYKPLKKKSHCLCSPGVCFSSGQMRYFPPEVEVIMGKYGQLRLKLKRRAGQPRGAHMNQWEKVNGLVDSGSGQTRIQEQLVG